MSLNKLAGKLLLNEPLANYCSWRVGGGADFFYVPKDKDDLQLFVSQLAAQQAIFYLGLGSNVLIRDGGIRGIVVNIRGHLKTMKLLSDTALYVESGVPCAHVARFCAQHGLTGAAFLAGIPGTIGGALKMNAGAFGAELWDLVARVETLSSEQGLLTRKATDFKVAYRSVAGLAQGECFVAAVLDFANQVPDPADIKALLAKRAATQPIDRPSCGSVFKNPENDYAARLIEACQLKAHKMGGAEVSEKHANFIINTGDATAYDIEQLIAYVQKTVFEQHGVQLQTEVCLVGEYK